MSATATPPVADTAAQLRRVLDLVPHMADGEPHTFDELAARAGVDANTVLADLRTLVPTRDVAGFVDALQLYLETGRAQVHTAHFLRPMRLTPAELRALELGLAVLGAERPREERDVLDRARQRLARALAAARPPRGAAPTDVVTEAANEAVAAVPRAATLAPLNEVGRRTLATLRAGRRAGRKVRLTYRKPGSDVAGARTVCPYATVAVHGAWYLVAWCEGAGAVRVFRVDRMDAAALTDAPYAVPDDFRLGAVLRGGRAFAAQPLGEELVVRYGPHAARWVAEREGVPVAEDGSVTVRWPLADEGWAVRHVLQYGADAEVLAPARVRAAVAERVRTMLAR